MCLEHKKELYLSLFIVYLSLSYHISTFDKNYRCLEPIQQCWYLKMLMCLEHHEMELDLSLFTVYLNISSHISTFDKNYRCLEKFIKITYDPPISSF